MKRIVLYTVVTFCLAGCLKEDEDLGPYTLLDVGIEYAAAYRVQQFVQMSTNPVTWNYIDLPGPVVLHFLNDSIVSEAHGLYGPVKRSFTLSERNRIQKPKEIQYKISFLEGPACTTDTCPNFIVGDGIIFNQFLDIIVQKPGSNSLEGFRLVKL